MMRVQPQQLVLALLAALCLLVVAQAACTGETCNNPSEKAKALVQDKVATHKVVVFSKSYCPYSIKAKKALATLLQPSEMEVVELDQVPAGEITGSDIQDALLEVTGGRSVPRVFVDGKFIGGGDDTAAKAANGELKQLLVAAGAMKEL